jgi:lysozyme
MKTSPRGAAFIAAQEGVVTHAYRDVAGVWTIGVGHTASAGPPTPSRGMTITHEEALAILARDLARYERRVEAALPGVPQAAFDGAVSFDFNTGAINRAAWVKAFCAGDAAKVRAQLALWNKAGGKVVAGLVKRRSAEARLILDGDYGEAAAMPAIDGAVAADLARLGFTGDDAVLRYQRAHPDLLADGIAGPATRAAIARDLAARRAVAGGLAGAGAAVVAASGLPWLAAALLLAALAIFAGVSAWRRRDELIRFLKPKVTA